MIELKQLISQNEACSFQQLNKFEKELKKLITDYVPSKELYQKLKEIVPLDVLYNQKKTLMHIAEKISRSLLKDFIEEEIFFSNDFKEKDAEDFEILIYGILGEEKDQYQRSFKKLIDFYGIDKIAEFLETAQKKIKVNLNEELHNQSQNKIDTQSEKSILLKKKVNMEEQIKKNEIAYEKIPSVYKSRNDSLISIKSKNIEKEEILNFQQMLIEFLANYFTMYVQKYKLQEVFDIPGQNEQTEKYMISYIKQQFIQELNNCTADKEDIVIVNNILYKLQQKDQLVFDNIKRGLKLLLEFFTNETQNLTQQQYFTEWLINKVDMNDIGYINSILINYTSNSNISMNQTPDKKCIEIKVNQESIFGKQNITSKTYNGFREIHQNPEQFYPHKGQCDNLKNFFKNRSGILESNYSQQMELNRYTQQDPNKLLFNRIQPQQTVFTKKDVKKTPFVQQEERVIQYHQFFNPTFSMQEEQKKEQKKEKDIKLMKDYSKFVQENKQFFDKQKPQVAKGFFGNSFQVKQEKSSFFNNDQILKQDQIQQQEKPNKIQPQRSFLYPVNKNDFNKQNMTIREGQQGFFNDDNSNKESFKKLDSSSQNQRFHEMKNAEKVFLESLNFNKQRNFFSQSEISNNDKEYQDEDI